MTQWPGTSIQHPLVGAIIRGKQGNFGPGSEQTVESVYDDGIVCCRYNINGKLCQKTMEQLERRYKVVGRVS